MPGMYDVVLWLFDHMKISNDRDKIYEALRWSISGLGENIYAVLRLWKALRAAFYLGNI